MNNRHSIRSAPLEKMVGFSGRSLGRLDDRCAPLLGGAPRPLVPLLFPAPLVPFTACHQVVNSWGFRQKPKKTFWVVTWCKHD